MKRILGVLLLAGMLGCTQEMPPSPVVDASINPDGAAFMDAAAGDAAPLPDASQDAPPMDASQDAPVDAPSMDATDAPADAAQDAPSDSA